MPKCVPKQHPKLLYLFRGKRSVDDVLKPRTGSDVTLYGDVGEWSDEKGEICEIALLQQLSSAKAILENMTFTKNN
jgi:hypothetical protein